MRAIITAQGIVAKSMITALLLRHQHVRLFSAPTISVFRVTNNGPNSLLLHLPTVRSTAGVCAWTLILLMAAVTLVLQGTLIALPSDEEVLGRASLPSAVNSPRTSGIPLSCHHRLYRAVEPDEVFGDTGTSIQGFYPISDKAEREITLAYRGEMTVVNTRVVCSRPSFDFIEFAPIEGTLAFGVSGDSGSILGLRDQEIAHLYPNISGRGGFYSMDPYSRAHIFVNTTGGQIEWGDSLGYSFIRQGSEPWVKRVDASSAKGAREWAILEFNKDVSLSITVCVVTPLSRNVAASVSRPKAVKEPSVRWKIATAPGINPSGDSKPEFDVKSVCTHMGSTSNSSGLSRGDRGIYFLLKPESWTTPKSELPPVRDSAGIAASGYSDMSIYPMWLVDAFTADLGALSNLQGFLFCSVACRSISKSTRKATEPLTIESSIFQSVPQDTGRIAKAFQAIITMYAATACYEFAPYFNASTQAEIKKFTKVDMPVQSRFALIIVLLAVIHLLLIFVVTLFFLFHLKADEVVIGGSWAALGPLFGGEDTVRWMTWTSKLPDKQVKKYMESMDVADVRVGFGEYGRSVTFEKEEGEL
ncbi:hypothetical protein QBC38DRAFT_502054 [Podospora fimiseda]|uniref:Uncharacterized protein n=1 Tax=Podospora fimiseda TaxID=252190 RepID=A0AAN7BJK6_9PEZI|nr:hypothetical protein QBC38DRAFT_502054 [Podospora fimiseda]